MGQSETIAHTELCYIPAEWLLNNLKLIKYIWVNVQIHQCSHPTMLCVINEGSTYPNVVDSTRIAVGIPRLTDAVKPFRCGGSVVVVFEIKSCTYLYNSAYHQFQLCH